MADVKICDRCGKKITVQQTLINIRPVRYILGEQVFSLGLGWMRRDAANSYDLCNDCANKLQEFLNGGITEATDAVVKE